MVNTGKQFGSKLAGPYCRHGHITNPEDTRRTTVFERQDRPLAGGRGVWRGASSPASSMRGVSASSRSRMRTVCRCTLSLRRSCSGSSRHVTFQHADCIFALSAGVPCLSSIPAMANCEHAGLPQVPSHAQGSRVTQNSRICIAVTQATDPIRHSMRQLSAQSGRCSRAWMDHLERILLLCKERRYHRKADPARYPATNSYIEGRLPAIQQRLLIHCGQTCSMHPI